MEITINLPQETIKEIAREMYELQKLDNPPEKSKNEIKNFTINQVAKLTNQHARTVNRHIEKGNLIAKKTGKKFLITETNLKKYIENDK
jgi:excisionase family DNA binding protein